MQEVWTTKSYWYEFAEVENVDYVFTISAEWYDDVVDTLFYELTWLTPEQESQLTNTVKKWDVILNKWIISIPL